MHPLNLKSLGVFVVFLIASPWVRPAAAQDVPGPAGEFAAGALLFADDGIETEGFVGGAARFYLLPRVSVGPELAYIQGDNHSHLMLTGNVTFDFLRPMNGAPAAFTPFAVVGGGIFRTREDFPNNEVFTSTEGAFTAGGGVRALLGNSVLVGAEARVGWELHVRFNALLGFQF